MKHYLGLLVLLLSFDCLAKTTTAVLFLRATVPETYKVDIEIDREGIRPKMRTNTAKGHARPKFFVHKLPKSYVVSIVHP